MASRINQVNSSIEVKNRFQASMLYYNCRTDKNYDGIRVSGSQSQAGLYKTITGVFFKFQRSSDLRLPNPVTSTCDRFILSDKTANSVH